MSPRIRPTNPAAPRSRGFTLVELMIALLLGSLLTIALIGFFVYGNRSYRQDDQVSKLQDELRFAMSQITRDLEMAGFWASILDPSNISLDANLTLDGDCGPAVVGPMPGTPAATWVYGDRQPIAYADNATPAQANAAFPCIGIDEFPLATAAGRIGNPDVVAVKRVASELSYAVDAGDIDLLGDGDAATPEDMTPSLVYLQSNGFTGILFRLNNAPPAASPLAPYEYWRYRPTVYYIRNYTDNPGDGVPSLCRKVIAVAGATPSLTDAASTECLATGVEDLQVEYGIDTDADAAPNYYSSTPNAGELTQLAAARVTLLARSEQRDPHYTNPKTYTLNPGKVVTPADSYYRRTLSTTVLLRNPAALGTFR